MQPKNEFVSTHKKGKNWESLLQKRIGFSVIKDTLDEFEAAKERVDQAQEEEKIKQRY